MLAANELRGIKMFPHNSAVAGFETVSRLIHHSGVLFHKQIISSESQASNASLWASGSRRTISIYVYVGA